MQIPSNRLLKRNKFYSSMMCGGRADCGSSTPCRNSLCTYLKCPFVKEHECKRNTLRLRHVYAYTTLISFLSFRFSPPLLLLSFMQAAEKVVKSHLKSLFMTSHTIRRRVAARRLSQKLSCSVELFNLISSAL